MFKCGNLFLLGCHLLLLSGHLSLLLLNGFYQYRRKSGIGNCFKAVGIFLNEFRENLLYFLEKNAPLLEPWQREVIRIVRKMAQYFYPQRQTQVMNEGCGVASTLDALRPHYDAAVAAGKHVGVACGMKNVGMGNGFEEEGRVRQGVGDGTGGKVQVKAEGVPEAGQGVREAEGEGDQMR